LILLPEAYDDGQPKFEDDDDEDDYDFSAALLKERSQTRAPPLSSHRPFTAR